MVGLSAATVMCARDDSAAEPPIFCVAQEIVADQDVVDAAVDHHLGLAELLAGDALGAGGGLHLGEHRALVRLDVRAVGDAGGVTDACTRAMLRSTRSRSITTAGVPNSRAILAARDVVMADPWSVFQSWRR